MDSWSVIHEWGAANKVTCITNSASSALNCGVTLMLWILIDNLWEAITQRRWRKRNPSRTRMNFVVDGGELTFLTGRGSKAFPSLPQAPTSFALSSIKLLRPLPDKFLNHPPRHLPRDLAPNLRALITHPSRPVWPHLVKNRVRKPSNCSSTHTSIPRVTTTIPTIPAEALRTIIVPKLLGIPNLCYMYAFRLPFILGEYVDYLACSRKEKRNLVSQVWMISVKFLKLQMSTNGGDGGH